MNENKEKILTKEEKQKKEKKEIAEAKKTIKIKKLYYDTDYFDSANVYISWENMSEKTIKYVTFFVDPYNAVGDKIDLLPDTPAELNETGPFKKGHGGNDKKYYSSVWLDGGDIKKIKINKIKIEYMDGSKKTLTGKCLEYIY